MPWNCLHFLSDERALCVTCNGEGFLLHCTNLVLVLGLTPTDLLFNFVFFSDDVVALNSTTECDLVAFILAWAKKHRAHMKSSHSSHLATISNPSLHEHVITPAGVLGWALGRASSEQASSAWVSSGQALLGWVSSGPVSLRRASAGQALGRPLGSVLSFYKRKKNN